MISNIQLSVFGTTVYISWDTNEQATSQIEYGKTISYGSFTQLDSTYKTKHNVTLKALLPTTQYYFKVHSKDSAGNLVSSTDMVFTTETSCTVADSDYDGFASIACGGTDCNDNSPSTYPNAPEICGDSTDQNCDSLDVSCQICQVNTSISSRCSCGSLIVSSGYCCNNLSSSTECSNPTLPQPCSQAQVTSPCICGSTTISAGYCCNSTYSITECEPQACSDGEARECGIGIGICAKGIQTCANLAWSDCIGAINPTNEICNNLDDNCDGTIDEYIANCSTAQIKPLCDENWICGDWKNCSSNRRQYRDCTDLNNCSSSFNKPKTMQSCKPSSATKNTESTAKEKVEYLRNKKTLPGNKTAEMEEIGQEETGNSNSGNILFYSALSLMILIAGVLFLYKEQGVLFNKQPIKNPESDKLKEQYETFDILRQEVKFMKFEGKPDEKIRRNLIAAGWKKEIIDDVLKGIK